MTNTLYIFARIRPTQEHKASAMNAIAGILQRTRSEAGCISFDMFEGNEDDCLYLIEEWVDQNALDIHYSQPYVTTVFAAYEEWLAEPIQVTKLHKAAIN